jgi:hypothetical protein
VAGDRTRLDKEELHNLNVSSNTVRVIKSRKVRWAGHIALMREMRNAYSILVGNGNGSSGSIKKAGYFFDKPSDYQVFE